jgi:hypothetical protein
MKPPETPGEKRLSEMFNSPSNVLVIYPPRQERIYLDLPPEPLGLPQPLSKKVTSIFAARKPKTPET